MKTLITTSIFLFLLFSCKEKSLKIEASTENKVYARIIEENYKYEASYKVESYFENLDKKVILSRLFESNQFDDSNYLHWLPSYDERQFLPLSFDGKCHTKIDTIMYFNDKNNVKCAVVVFGHYNFVRNYPYSTEIKIGDGHFNSVLLGVALFSYSNENEWVLYAFRKKIADLGYFGKYTEDSSISLKTIGDKWTCLSLVQEIGGNSGFDWGYESLFAIETKLNKPYDIDLEEGPYYEYILGKMFTYNYYHSRCFEKCDITKRKLNFIKKKNDYYDIRLDIVKNNKKFTEYYYYDDFYNKYLLKK